MEDLPQPTGPRGLGHDDLRRIAELAFDHWGLCISEAKRQLVHGQLQLLAEALDQDGLDGLLRRLFAAKTNAALLELFGAMCGAQSSFFERPADFDWLRSFLGPRLAQGSGVRLWSAGCTTGCEAYSLAILLAELCAGGASRGSVLASDASASNLELAQLGLYPPGCLSGLDPALLATHLEPKRREAQAMYRVRPHLQKTMRFQQLDLRQAWEHKGEFDAILCRSAWQELAAEQQAELIDRFAGALRPGGALLLGTDSSHAAPHPKLRRDPAGHLLRL